MEADHVMRAPTLAPWQFWASRRASISTEELSEVQPWLSRLPFRMQGTVFAALRGGDLVSKPLSVTIKVAPCGPDCDMNCPWSHTDDAPERQLVQWLRWLCLRAADEREVDHPGSYMQSKPPRPTAWKPSMFGAQPMHWYMHLAHAFEVVGHELPERPIINHPDANVWLRSEAYQVYYRMVTALHLVPESREQFWARMTEDRIASRNVVS